MLLLGVCHQDEYVVFARCLARFYEIFMQMFSGDSVLRIIYEFVLVYFIFKRLHF